MTRLDPDDIDVPVPDPEKDRELAPLLHEWSVPALPDSLDERVLRSFRERRPRFSLWRRFLTGSVRVPLPVALALLLLGLAVWMARVPAPPQDASESPEPARNALAIGRELPSASLAGFRPVQEINVTVLPQTEAP